MADDIIPAADLPLGTPGALDTVVGVDESTGNARRFRTTELPASTAAQAQLDAAVAEAEAARDAAQASGNIYADTTAGLAAVADGEYFSVPSADSDEYLILYRRADASTATEVKRYPAAAAIESAISPLRDATETGSYAETFASNTPITATNLTDAVTPSQTYTYGASGLTIALATGSRTIKYSTKNKVGGKKARVVLTQVANSGTGSYGPGFAIGNNAYWYTGSDGRVTTNDGGGLLATGPTYAAGATITTTIDIDDAGTMVATWSHSGGSVSITRTGITMGDFALIQRGVSNVTHSAVFSAIGDLLSEHIDAEARAELTADDALNIKAVAGLLAQLQRSVPSGLTFPVPYDFRAYKMADARVFFTNIDLRAPLVEGDIGVTTYYVDPVSGSDSNAGTSAAPFKSISKALASAGSQIIIKAKPGLYDKDTGWKSTGPSATILQVVPWGVGDIVASCHHSGLVWSLVSGSTYSATITTVSTVYDASILTADGDYSPLEAVASQAAVDATPGSYYVSGTTIYLRTSDSRAPDSNIRVYNSTGLGNGSLAAAGSTTYLESVKFHGGDSALRLRLASPSTSGTLLAKSCDFKYAGGDGFDVNGHWLCVMQGCVAAQNGDDGFNYHAIFGSPGPNMIEVDCIGRWNGRDASGTNNGSTMHDPDSLGIRVNGLYHHNEDRNVHDVGGAQSWNICCEARDSQASGTITSANFVAGLSGEPTTTKMWLDACTSSGSTYDLGAPSGAGVVYTSDLVSGGNNVAGADVQAYTP